MNAVTAAYPDYHACCAQSNEKNGKWSSSVWLQTMELVFNMSVLCWTVDAVLIKIKLDQIKFSVKQNVIVLEHINIWFNYTYI